MNLGAWALSAFGLPVSLLAGAQIFGVRRLPARAVHLAGASVRLHHAGLSRRASDDDQHSAVVAVSVARSALRLRFDRERGWGALYRRCL